MEIWREHFDEVWVQDFEFHHPAGELPEPLTLAATEVFSGRSISLRTEQLRELKRAPFDTGPDALSVGYFFSAESGCYRALGWPQPENILDLFPEFVQRINGPRPKGVKHQRRGLADAVEHFGLAGIDSEEKERSRQIAIKHTADELSFEQWGDLQRYNLEDVRHTADLLGCMAENIDLPRALLRGRNAPVVAAIEATGYPVDVEWLDAINANLEPIKAGLIRQFDQFGIYQDSHFRESKFLEVCERFKIPWPRLKDGSPALDDDETFKKMVARFPVFQPLRHLRHLLGQLSRLKLKVGRDGRARYMVSPFGQDTGRNNPSGGEFIFSHPKWARSVVRADPGYALVYIDSAGNELGIAAALSHDENLTAAYFSDDPYLWFARRVGLAPAGATKKTHPKIRALCKVVGGLGTMYGQGAQSAALATGRTVAEMTDILEKHHRLFSKFWRWSDGIVSFGKNRGYVQTDLGWRLPVTKATKTGTLRNFMLQAGGAEYLRLVSFYLYLAGLEVVALVHDAVLIHARIADIEEVERLALSIFDRASEELLGGFRLRSKVETIPFPGHFPVEEGAETLAVVRRILGGLGVGHGAGLEAGL
jgi:hypothetical protein